MPRGAWPRVRPCTPRWPQNWTGDRFSSLSLKVTGCSLPARLRSHGSHMLTPPVAGSIPTFGEQWPYRGGRRTSVGARRNKIIGSIAVTALVAGLLTIWPGAAHALPVEKTIAEIQGTGDTSPEAGNAVTTKGVVTAAYPTGNLRGYTIQTAGAGGLDGVSAQVTGRVGGSDHTLGGHRVARLGCG